MAKNNSTHDLWRMVGATLRDWMEAALDEMHRHEHTINQLNVFPVPDGDTGRNMAATLKSAVDALHRAGSLPLDEAWAQVAEGALMGARGNSGVILSQLLAGFAEEAQGQVYWEARDFQRALRRAAQRARQQVTQPVEGTILTVADQAHEGCRIDGSLLDALESAVRAAEAALARTPEQLPQLRAHAVVDAGARGYVAILTGWLKAASGRWSADTSEPQGDLVFMEPKAGFSTEIRYFYDVEALLHRLSSSSPETELTERLSPIGDSIVIAPGPDMVKVHVHTDNPAALMEVLTAVGAIRQMELLDMRHQVHERAEEQGLLTVVVDPAYHPVFADCRTVTPAEGQDRPGVLWIQNPETLKEAVAVPTVGMAGQAVLEYLPGDSWQDNRRRLTDVLAVMRHWVVSKTGETYQWDGRTGSRRNLAEDVRHAAGTSGVVTVYLSQHADREEAMFWQEALDAAVVQVPHAMPWLEVVWQP